MRAQVYDIYRHEASMLSSDYWTGAEKGTYRPKKDAPAWADHPATTLASIPEEVVTVIDGRGLSWMTKMFTEAGQNSKAELMLSLNSWLTGLGSDPDMDVGFNIGKMTGGYIGIPTYVLEFFGYDPGLTYEKARDKPVTDLLHNWRFYVYVFAMLSGAMEDEPELEQQVEDAYADHLRRSLAPDRELSAVDVRNAKASLAASIGPFLEGGELDFDLRGYRGGEVGGGVIYNAQGEDPIHVPGEMFPPADEPPNY